MRIDFFCLACRAEGLSIYFWEARRVYTQATITQSTRECKARRASAKLITRAWGARERRACSRALLLLDLWLKVGRPSKTTLILDLRHKHNILRHIDLVLSARKLSGYIVTTILKASGRSILLPPPVSHQGERNLSKLINNNKIATEVLEKVTVQALFFETDSSNMHNFAAGRIRVPLGVFTSAIRTMPSLPGNHSPSLAAVYFTLLKMTRWTIRWCSSSEKMVWRNHWGHRSPEWGVDY